LDDLAVAFTAGRAIRTPEGLGHFHPLGTVGLGDPPGQRQQFPALLLGQLRQVRAVGFDGAQYLNTGAQRCGVDGIHRRIVRWGMDDAEPIPPMQQFGAQAVRDTLGRSTDVDACVALVHRLDQLLVQAAQHLQPPGAGLACRAGCNFCCHLQVRVLPHEAIALFRYLQSRMPAATAERVRTRVREQAAGTATGRACAFLVDGQCAAYEARPSACAGYHSLSKAHCEQSFWDPSLPSGTVALRALQVVAAALEDGVNAALVMQGLNQTRMELHTAVAALLADPARIARWRAGRPLLNLADGLPRKQGE